MTKDHVSIYKGVIKDRSKIFSTVLYKDCYDYMYVCHVLVSEIIISTCFKKHTRI